MTKHTLGLAFQSFGGSGRAIGWTSLTWHESLVT